MQPSRMDKAEFVAVFGDVFEHSPWIAGRVWESGLDVFHDKAARLHRAFAQVIHAANHEQKLSLLQAHPELAAGIVSEKELTTASQAEQRAAGLDQCSTGEFAEFQHLNESYRARFGFPFIMAVKESSRLEILEAFRTRLANTRKQELQAAVEQVMSIARFRIESKFE